MYAIDKFKCIKISLISFLLFLEVISVFLTFKSFSFKPNELEKKYNHDIKNNMFAIMIEGNDGTYETYEGSGFPTTGYVYDESMSGCVDSKGKEIDGILIYNTDTNEVTVSTTRTSYCYLYFSMIKTAPGTMLEGEENISFGLQAGMYRYQGTRDVVDNNYICFGTSSKTDCLANTDKYMYRIIGIKENNQMKLIKNTSLGNKAWHSDRTVDTTWPNSDLFKSLNGLESETITPIFIGNSTYDYMAKDSLWYNKVATSEWRYGDITSTYSYNGPNMYAIENPFEESTTSGAWTEETSGKVSLRYIHDYYYAYGVGGAPGSSANAGKAWIILFNEWTMSRYGLDGGTYSAWSVVAGGSMYRDYVTNTRAVRPVFYLESTVEITGGTGTSGDPFILN